METEKSIFKIISHTIKYDLTTLSTILVVRNRITNLILKYSFDITYVLSFQLGNTRSLYIFTFQNISNNFFKKPNLNKLPPFKSCFKNLYTLFLRKIMHRCT